MAMQSASESGQVASPGGRTADGTVDIPWGTANMHDDPAIVLPLAYGYLRVDLVDDGDRAAGLMVEAARRLGCELAVVFWERSPQSTVPPAWLDLVCECCRAEAHTVFTAPGHLCDMALPRMVLLEMLAVRADAQVCEVSL